MHPPSPLRCGLRGHRRQGSGCDAFDISRAEAGVRDALPAPIFISCLLPASAFGLQIPKLSTTLCKLKGPGKAGKAPPRHLRTSELCNARPLPLVQQTSAVARPSSCRPLSQKRSTKDPQGRDLGVYLKAWKAKEKETIITAFFSPPPPPRTLTSASRRV